MFVIAEVFPMPEPAMNSMLVGGLGHNGLKSRGSLTSGKVGRTGRVPLFSLLKSIVGFFFLLGIYTT